ncbi:MAG: prohibitin family protein [Bacteroidales bacterium]|nr:prohibitin family protein [Bacteroidales bacterium]
MKKSSTYIIIGSIIFLIIILSSNKMFYKLVPGERAVIFRQFTTGLDKDNIFMPGFHLIAPWNDLLVYNVKEQQSEETMDVLSKNGLSVNIDVSVRFNPIYDKIGSLHEIFGVNYINTLVVPEVRSSVRQVAGRYTPEEIYSTKRDEVEKTIIYETAIILKENNIDMKALLIRSINLPKDIKQAIENKLTREQEALSMEYVKDKERAEAERKIIEANGISKYNKIVNASLTERILKQKGIDATLKLSESPNAKVVVIGSGKDGMPLILGGN